MVTTTFDIRACGYEYVTGVVDTGVISTRCRPSIGRRCIPDAALKNEGSMMQTCQNINVHVVITDIYVETYRNVYGLHKKADLSMCTA